MLISGPGRPKTFNKQKHCCSTRYIPYIVIIVYDNKCHQTIPQYTVSYSVVHKNIISTTRNVMFFFQGTPVVLLYSSCTAVPQEMLSFFSWHYKNIVVHTTAKTIFSGYSSCCTVYQVVHKNISTTENVTFLFRVLQFCTAVPKGRTAFSAVCHGPANIQATSAVECDLWYGVRRPYVALVCRCYTDLERAKSFES